MKTCSYCGRENEDTAVACSACGVELASPHAPEIDPESVTVRVAAKDYNAAMAIVAKGADATPAGLPPGPSESQQDACPESAAAETYEERTGDLQGRKLCVSCGAVIPDTAHLCPKCGWTQSDSR